MSKKEEKVHLTSFIEEWGHVEIGLKGRFLKVDPDKELLVVLLLQELIELG